MTKSGKDIMKNPFVPETLAQAINPWSWWFGTNANQNQNGFINVTTYKSGNPKLEQKIIGEVAGYGMQLGMIEDMIEMMIGFLPKSQLNEAQVKTIAKFKDMVAQIEAHKQQVRLEEFSAGGVERLIENLGKLKEQDPQLYDQVSQRLKSVL